MPEVKDAVLDGEIVCLDKRGHPQFRDLLFRRGEPCFFAFDLLWNGKDHRRDALTDRKQELRRLLTKVSPPFPVRYADHIDGSGKQNWEKPVKGARMILCGVVEVRNLADTSRIRLLKSCHRAMFRLRH